MQKQPLKRILDIQYKHIFINSIFNEGPDSFLEMWNTEFAILNNH
jgi:hypothetical protein